MKNWMVTQKWTEILTEKNMDTKAQLLNQMVLEKLDEFCPEKARKISSDDEPWFSDQLKRLDRRRRRQFRLNRRSRKYKKLQRLFKRKVSEAKRLFKKKFIDDVSNARDGQWYSKLKRISNYDQARSEQVQVEEISHMTDH